MHQILSDIESGKNGPVCTNLESLPEVVPNETTEAPKGSKIVKVKKVI